MNILKIIDYAKCRKCFTFDEFEEASDNGCIKDVFVVDEPDRDGISTHCLLLHDNTEIIILVKS